MKDTVFMIKMFAKSATFHPLTVTYVVSEKKLTNPTATGHKILTNINNLGR